jgi:hypothetical protein
MSNTLATDDNATDSTVLTLDALLPLLLLLLLLLLYFLLLLLLLYVLLLLLLYVLLLLLLYVLLLLLLLLQRGMGEEATIKFMAVAHTDSGIVTAVRGEH